MACRPKSTHLQDSKDSAVLGSRARGRRARGRSGGPASAGRAASSNACHISAYSLAKEYGFTSPRAEIDFREVRTSLVCMRARQGSWASRTCTAPNLRTLHYKKIVSMEIIQNLVDKDGNKAHAVRMGLLSCT